MSSGNKSLTIVVSELTKPFHGLILKLISIISLIAFIDAANTYFLSRIFNLVSNRFNISTIIFWCCLTMFGVGLRIFFISWRDKYGMIEFENLLENYFDEKSARKFLSLSSGQHMDEHSAVRQNIVTNGTNSIKAQLSMVVHWILPMLATFFSALTMLIVIKPWIGLYYLIGAFILGKKLSAFHKELGGKIKEISDMRDDAAKIKQDIFRHAIIIKNEAAENRIVEELNALQKSILINNKSAWVDGINRLITIRIIGQTLKWSSIFFALYILNFGLIEIGHIFLIFFWSDKFIESVWGIADAQKEYIKNKVNIEKYVKFLQTESEIKIPEGAIKEGLIGDIEFQDVSFGYKERDGGDKVKWVIDNLGFIIKNGEKVGVVGGSGSGKSTLVNLLRRAYDPQQGNILINGRNIKQIEITELLKKIGSVEQDIVLFDKTIRENISFGLDRLLEDGELETIAKLSGVYKFYHKLENGWDTKIGEQGCKLSGGEKQRVCIARALAKKPEILIFDEATSALDMISEQEVQESIELSCGGKTAIIIAHRLATVKNCDRIFVMKDGKIINTGTHNELMEICEYYKAMVEKQQIGQTH